MSATRSPTETRSHSESRPPAETRVIGVVGNIVSIESSGPIMKNEVAYVVVDGDRLKSEVLRVVGNRADLQVFEETQGVRVGDRVELTKQMLSASLGPGLLGVVFDGLQNPLHPLAERDGYFLHRGRTIRALPADDHWNFTPRSEAGSRIHAGDVIGTVPERRIRHKIMVPFDFQGPGELLEIESGSMTVDQPVARCRDRRGRERVITMSQDWPVRRPLSAGLVRQRLCERQFPTTPLTTTMRTVDTFFPIARGGTACIPGPFGAGKTVLQGLIARYSDVDIVVVVACGERAGEVVETIHEFSNMEDPHSGGKLIDRTIIICNTSSMPVAAREASIYTGITIGEYYRQMGLNVLLIADSTSRWAQSMRETSGRLEEIPGEEAFPAYLDSAIKGVYERAGVLVNRGGDKGSLTMIGTVSPAGGNFEEPVTQSTLGAVKCFLGLSSDRAYKRFYPAIDPLFSWSRYLGQLRPYLDRTLDPYWTRTVEAMTKLLHQGDAIHQMMQVTGEEGISLEDFVIYQKAQFLDMVYLQQDAFDPVDVSTPTERQKASFQLIRRLIEREYDFRDKEHARDYFIRLTGLYKNLNYAAWRSQQYQDLADEITELGHDL